MVEDGRLQRLAGAKLGLVRRKRFLAQALLGLVQADDDDRVHRAVGASVG
jgi:hypothetical protein